MEMTFTHQKKVGLGENPVVVHLQSNEIGIIAKEQGGIFFRSGDFNRTYPNLTVLGPPKKVLNTQLVEILSKIRITAGNNRSLWNSILYEGMDTALGEGMQGGEVKWDIWT